jgi:exopolyphosphatase/guanosine-5'-triphosphate,3'-diphosphate pyrophosphatase
MRAVMDIGTNSTRLLLADYDGTTGQLHPLKRGLKITRIGEGMIEKNRVMSPGAMERTIAALEDFAGIIAAYPVEKIRLVATQAVREAANQAELKERIKERLGWTLEVISGAEEAKLSYRGAVQGLQTVGSPFVVDIGGGSTEFLVEREEGAPGAGEKGSNGSKLQARSLPLGALRLFEKPLSDAELQSILAKGLAGFQFSPEASLVVVGGTATTLAAVKLELVSYDAEKVQGLTIPFTALNEISQWLEAMSPAERLKVPGITPGREDIIVPGLQILRTVMTYFGRTELTVSDQDLLHGLIMGE